MADVRVANCQHPTGTKTAMEKVDDEKAKQKFQIFNFCFRLF